MVTARCLLQAAVQELRRRGVSDERVGIGGHSYGDLPLLRHRCFSAGHGPRPSLWSGLN